VIGLVIVLVLCSLATLVFVGLFVRRSRSAARSSVGGPSDTPILAPQAAAAVVVEAGGLVEGTQVLETGAVPDLRDRLSRSRGLFASLRSLRTSSRIDQSVLEELEAVLLSADVGVSTTEQLLEAVRGSVREHPGESGGDLLGVLRTALLELLSHGPDGELIDRGLSELVEPGRIPVWLFVGVNGVGKTTTIGKLAARELTGARRVVLAAGDTFRAAAADQLEAWGTRVGADVVRGAEGGDPSAVVFDAIQRAGARHADLVLADTAGRLHTKVNLIEELKKIRRVADREPGQVSEVLLVLDATTGQNGLNQARQFLDAVEVTGVVLSKLDGTARGGVVVAIQRELGLPVKLVGLGEGAEDLVAFEPEAFVDALLAP
jgi:fused signal recognition particle receptor